MYRRHCPTKNLEAHSCTISLRAGGQSVSKAASIPFAIHNARDVSTWNGKYYYHAGTAPCVSTICLLDASACDQISQAFPHHNCILQAIKYWRWEWPGNEASSWGHLQLCPNCSNLSRNSISDQLLAHTYYQHCNNQLSVHTYIKRLWNARMLSSSP